MSNIPGARQLLLTALDTKMSKRRMRLYIKAALANMTRLPAVTRARRKPVRITFAMKQRVRTLAKMGWSQAEIARKVGLANAGRVSEILHWKR